jgi:hypothetical protein
MARYIAISLFCILLLSLSGYYPVLLLERTLARREFKAKMREGLASKDLQVLRLIRHQPGIEWEKPGKEFKYQGHLFDIVSADTTGETVTLTCYKDEKERGIVQGFQKILVSVFKDDTSASGRAITFVKMLLSAVYIVADLPSLLPLQSIDISISSFTASLQAGYLSPGFRPPVF